MNYSDYRLTLDIHDIRSNVVVKVKRGDNTRRLRISLTENGKVYQIADACTAVFKGKKPDGKSLYNDCTIEDNCILYVMGNNTTSAIGIVECEVSLISGDGEVISSPTFSILVEANVISDDDVVDSNDEATALVKLFADKQDKFGNVLKADGVNIIETNEELIFNSQKPIQFHASNNPVIVNNLNVYKSADGTGLIKNVSTPQNDDDASNKKYVDESFGGLLYSANKYTDDAVANSNQYTDNKATQIETNVDSVAKTRADEALADSKDYTDAEVAKAKAHAESVAQSSASSALESSKQYTNDKLASIESGGSGQSAGCQWTTIFSHTFDEVDADGGITWEIENDNPGISAKIKRMSEFQLYIELPYTDDVTLNAFPIKVYFTNKKTNNSANLYSRNVIANDRANKKPTIYITANPVRFGGRFRTLSTQSLALVDHDPKVELVSQLNILVDDGDLALKFTTKDTNKGVIKPIPKGTVILLEGR